jgi:Gas vesicle synthesis protein GvpL/GvpF
MTVHYVYGVLPYGQHVPDLAHGPDGVDVQLVVGHGLAAAVSELPADRYGEEEFRAHREDPVWLQELATAHHRVLASIALHGDVVPLRMPTLCRSRQSVLELLDTQGEVLHHALAAVSGRVEWGVKLYAEPRPDGGQKVEAASGRDYLGQRMAQGQARDEERQRRGDVVRACHSALSLTADDATVNAPQDPALSGRSEPMLLNGAYLVARQLESAFLAVLDAHAGGPCREAGIVAEVTGPWPPYNFSLGSLTEGRMPAGGP